MSRQLCMGSKEVRRERAHKAAEEYRVRTGNGPGRRGYIDTYFYAYFDHQMSSSEGIEGVVIEQFEALLDEIENYQDLAEDQKFHSQ